MNMRKKMTMLTVLFALIGLAVCAQVTTSSISGFIKKNTGEVLSGSSVKLIHVPTGTVYQTSTGKDGRYSLVNLIPGGPYSIEITNVGFANYNETNINLPLGENTNLDASLNTTNTVLTDVVVTSTSSARKKPALPPASVKLR